MRDVPVALDFPFSTLEDRPAVVTLTGIDYDGLDRSIDVQVSRLRHRLSDDASQPELIKTVRGEAQPTKGSGDQQQRSGGSDEDEPPEILCGC